MASWLVVQWMVADPQNFGWCKSRWRWMPAPDLELPVWNRLVHKPRTGSFTFARLSTNCSETPSGVSTPLLITLQTIHHQTSGWLVSAQLAIVFAFEQEKTRFMSISWSDCKWCVLDRSETINCHRLFLKMSFFIVRVHLKINLKMSSA